jgi:hypothetical protein
MISASAAERSLRSDCLRPKFSLTAPVAVALFVRLVLVERRPEES